METIHQHAESDKLQEYADLHHGGDRLRAIYDLMYNSDVPGGFDPYVDELSEIEACFTMTILEEHAIKQYGGVKEYRNALKAEQLAAQLDVETDAVRNGAKNPYFKNWLLSLLGLVVAVGVSVAADIWWHISYIGEVAIGLASMYVAGLSISCLRFWRLKRLLARIPTVDASEEASDTDVPDFDTVLASFYARGYTYPEGGYMGDPTQPHIAMPSEEEVQSNQLLAKKRLIRGLWMLPLCALAAFVLLMLATVNGIVGIVGALALFAWIAWIVVSMFRALRRVRTIDGIKDDALRKQCENRQNIYA